MKKIKKILFGFFILLLVLNILVLVSGNKHLYKGIANTYLKGRSGPSIDEYHIFENRIVNTSDYVAIPNAKSYNTKKVNTAIFEQYKTSALLILKNDSVQYEQYWDGYSDSSITNSFSMAKSFVGVLIGCALQDGLIKSLDQPVGDFIEKFNEGENKKLTVRDLLTMSSGINFDEHYTNPFAYPAKAYYGNEIKKLTLKYEVTETPGKVFKYLSGNTELLGMILEKVSGKKLSEYMSDRLWKPMGAKHDAFWSLDHENGMEKAYCCFNSNARDFSRFGLLYLNKGNFNGKQLIDSNFVTAACTATKNVDEDGKPNNCYGYQWWMVDYKGYHIPYCRGILGQYIIVIPDLKIVAVRLGHDRDKQKVGHHTRDLFLYLDEIIENFK